MDRHAQGLRPGGAVAAVAIAAGLVLVGCGGSNGSSGSSGASSSSAPSTSSGGSGSSGSTSVVSAATVPFPVGVGDTWTYKTTYGKTIDKMTAVTPVSGGQKVTMTSAITSLGTTSDHTAYYLVNSDGSISLPFSEFATNNSSTSIKLISGSIFWPPAAELASGKAYHDTLQIEFKVSGVRQKVDAHVTVRGAGTQTVKVPAGTYNATVVNMTMTETVEGIAVSTEVRTWLATGVGPVKSEVIINEGGASHVLDENRLVSFKAG